MLTIPTVTDLSGFSGRPASSYVGYVNSALLQATIMIATITELDDDATIAALGTTDNLLFSNGLLAMADYIYLRFPYQQVIAAPLMNETVGSYSYSKAQQEVARNAAAGELQGENTGVTLYDMAVQYLARRTRAGGVYGGAITVFEEGSRIDGAELEIRLCDGRLVILGPSDRDQINIPFAISGESFPMDPGIG